MGERDVTVAVRLPDASTAISPNRSPGPSSRTGAPSTVPVGGRAVHDREDAVAEVALAGQVDPRFRLDEVGALGQRGEVVRGEAAEAARCAAPRSTTPRAYCASIRREVP